MTEEKKDVEKKWQKILYALGGGLRLDYVGWALILLALVMLVQVVLLSDGDAEGVVPISSGPEPVLPDSTPAVSRVLVHVVTEGEGGQSGVQAMDVRLFDRDGKPEDAQTDSLGRAIFNNKIVGERYTLSIRSDLYDLVDSVTVVVEEEPWPLSVRVKPRPEVVDLRPSFTSIVRGDSVITIRTTIQLEYPESKFVPITAQPDLDQVVIEESWDIRPDERITRRIEPTDYEYKNQVQAPLYIVFSLDQSYSMGEEVSQLGSRTKMTLTKEAAKKFIRRLRQDSYGETYVAISRFSNDSDPIVFHAVEEIGTLDAIINEARANGGTAMRDALGMALESLQETPEQAVRISVLLSDGYDQHSTVITTEALDEMIRKQDVQVVTVGYGSGRFQEVLKALSTASAGRFSTDLPKHYYNKESTALDSTLTGIGRALVQQIEFAWVSACTRTNEEVSVKFDIPYKVANDEFTAHIPFNYECGSVN